MRIVRMRRAHWGNEINNGENVGGKKDQNVPGAPIYR